MTLPTRPRSRAGISEGDLVDSHAAFVASLRSESKKVRRKRSNCVA